MATKYKPENNKERKVVRTVIDQRVEFPADGSVYFTVFEKTGDNSWESCAEFIEDEKEARLIAAAPKMKELLESACSSWGFMANDLSLGTDERLAARRKHDEARSLLDRIG